MNRRSIAGLTMMLLVIILMIVIFVEKELGTQQRSAADTEIINGGQSEISNADLLLMNETICPSSEQ